MLWQIDPRGILEEEAGLGISCETRRDKRE